MNYNKQTLEEILSKFSEKSSQKEEEETKKVYPFSPSYIREIKEFNYEKDAFDYAVQTLDFDKQLEILTKWRERYADDNDHIACQLTKKLDKLVCGVQGIINDREEFHKLVAEMHYAHEKKDFMREIDCYRKMYKSIGKHILNDVYMSKRNTSNSYTRGYIQGGKPRIYARLSISISAHLSELYKKLSKQYEKIKNENPSLVKNWLSKLHKQNENENPENFENYAKDWDYKSNKQYKKMTQAIEKSNNKSQPDYEPFGSIDAFGYNGIYGPSSPLIKDYLANIEQETIKASTIQTPQKPINNGLLFSSEEMKGMIDPNILKKMKERGRN